MSVAMRDRLVHADRCSTWNVGPDLGYVAPGAGDREAANALPVLIHSETRMSRSSSIRPFVGVDRTIRPRSRS